MNSAVKAGKAGNPGAKAPADSPEIAGGYGLLPMLTIKSKQVPAKATIGKSYSGTPTLSGGKALFTWTAFGLPPGLGINATSGAISGKPTSIGSFPVELLVTDSSTPDHAFASYGFTLVVARK
jgi:hypothetical protein